MSDIRFNISGHPELSEAEALSLADHVVRQHLGIALIAAHKLRSGARRRSGADGDEIDLTPAEMSTILMTLDATGAARQNVALSALERALRTELEAR
jgi:hypothetical protein